MRNTNAPLRLAALVLVVGLAAATRASEARDVLRVPRSGTITKVEPGRRGITIGRERRAALAAAAGTVASIDTRAHVVVLRHPHALETRYELHGSWQLCVHPDERVRAGQRLARDASRGKHAATLVFEARRGGRKLALPALRRGEHVRGGAPFPRLAPVSKIPPLAGPTFVARGTAYYPSNDPLQGGFDDRLGHPIHTLQDFLAGRAPYVSCAMDVNAFPYGQRLRIPELEREHGRVIDFRVVDTGGAFVGRGTSRIDICVRSLHDAYDATINGTLHLVVVK